MKCLRAWFAAPAFAGVFVSAAIVSTALLAAVVLSGCATQRVADLNADWPVGLAAQVDLAATPFFAQDDYECGPAALAMAMTAAGVPTSPGALVPQVYTPGRKGSLQVEMPVPARRAGLLAYELAPRLEAVLREVAAGHPVVVFQNLSLPWYPVWHYAVVVGFDREAQTLLLHSGTTARMPISMNAFERTWARGSHWAMVVLPPDTLPATAQAAPLAQALVALERVSPRSAFVGYGTALARWPTERSFLLGRGNAAYASANLPAARAAYTHAVSAVPDFADAWNNLAQVLLEQKDLAQARSAVQRAIALGGPRLADYEELLQAIESETKSETKSEVKSGAELPPR